MSIDRYLDIEFDENMDAMKQLLADHCWISDTKDYSQNVEDMLIVA